MADREEIDAAKPPSISEVEETPAYDRAATGVSKDYIVLFFIFCGVIGYLDQPNLGWLWAVVLIGGMFAASIVIAMPVTLFKLMLGSKGLISPFSKTGKLVLRLIDLIGYAVLWIATRAGIGALAG